MVEINEEGDKREETSWSFMWRRTTQPLRMRMVTGQPPLMTHTAQLHLLKVRLLHHMERQDKTHVNKVKASHIYVYGLHQVLWSWEIYQNSSGRLSILSMWFVLEPDNPCCIFPLFVIVCVVYKVPAITAFLHSTTFAFPSSNPISKTCSSQVQSPVFRPFVLLASMGKAVATASPVTSCHLSGRISTSQWSWGGSLYRLSILVTGEALNNQMIDGDINSSLACSWLTA